MLSLNIILLQKNDENPDVFFFNPFYVSGIAILFQELMESVQKAGIPIYSLRTLVLGLARELESLD